MPVVIAPAALIAAIFALLFMAAWYVWGNSIVNALNVNLPYIGNVIGNLIGDGLEATYTYLVYWFDSIIHPLGQLILSPISVIENTVSAAYEVTANVYNSLWGIVNVKIPIAESTAITIAGSLVGDARAFAHQELINVQTGVLAQIDSLRNGIASAYAQAVQYATIVGQEVLADAEGLFNIAIAQLDAAEQVINATIATVASTAAADTLAAYQAATGYAESLAQLAASNLAAATLALEGYADQAAAHAVGVLVTDIDQSITGALSGIYTDIDQAIDGVIDVIGTGDADVLAGIRAIPRVVPFDIAGVATLAGASTLALTRYLKECGIPNCKNLSQYGKDLQALLGLVGDASFLAFLVEIVEHPAAAKSIVDDTFGAIIGDTVSAGRSLLGV